MCGICAARVPIDRLACSERYLNLIMPFKSDRPLPAAVYTGPGRLVDPHSPQYSAAPTPICQIRDVKKDALAAHLVKRRLGAKMTHRWELCGRRSAHSRICIPRMPGYMYQQLLTYSTLQSRCEVLFIVVAHENRTSYVHWGIVSRYELARDALSLKSIASCLLQQSCKE